MTSHTISLPSGLAITVDDTGYPDDASAASYASASSSASSSSSSVPEASARPVLVLHGGGGPFTVAAIAAHLAGLADADTAAPRFRTITPTHPGWQGAPGAETIGSIAELASAYLELLAVEDLHDVLVIGSSLGGWLGAEMAVQEASAEVPQPRITGLILIDAAGIEVEGEPIRDFFALDARGVAEYSFHDSERFYLDPATLPIERIRAQQANMATMKQLAGDPYMHDPSLLGRLPGIQVPTLVLWGVSDRIMTPGYGAAYAAAIPDARFELIEAAGHLPQIEQPGATFALIDDFAGV